MSDDPGMEIRPDVRNAAYVRGGCPGCGRHRLEVFVDGEGERAVGIECEKCHRQWLLDPAKADAYGDYDDRNPLRPGLPDNDPFGGSP
jgi:hypothetical protein